MKRIIAISGSLEQRGPDEANQMTPDLESGFHVVSTSEVVLDGDSESVSGIPVSGADCDYAEFRDELNKSKSVINLSKMAGLAGFTALIGLLWVQEEDPLIVRVMCCLVISTLGIMLQGHEAGFCFIPLGGLFRAVNPIGYLGSEMTEAGAYLARQNDVEIPFLLRSMGYVGANTGGAWGSVKLFSALAYFSNALPKDTAFPPVFACNVSSNFNSFLGSQIDDRIMDGSVRDCYTDTPYRGFTELEHSLVCTVGVNASAWQFFCRDGDLVTQIMCGDPATEGLIISPKPLARFNFFDYFSPETYMNLIQMLSESQVGASSKETITAVHKTMSTLQQRNQRQAPFLNAYFAMNDTAQRTFFGKAAQRVFGDSFNERRFLFDLSEETNKLFSSGYRNSVISAHESFRVSSFGAHLKPSGFTSNVGQYSGSSDSGINQFSWFVRKETKTLLSTLVHEGSHARQLACSDYTRINLGQKMHMAAIQLDNYIQKGKLTNRIDLYVSSYHTNEVETTAEYETAFHLNGTDSNYKVPKEFNAHNDRLINEFDGDPAVKTVLLDFQRAYTDLLNNLERAYPAPGDRLDFEKIKQITGAYFGYEQYFSPTAMNSNDIASWIK